MTLKELRNRAKKLDLNEIASKVIATHKAELIDFNTSQLQRGVDSKDSKLSDYESEVYYEFKASQGLATAGRTYNFFVTGSFYEGFVVKESGNDFRIDSTDEKRGFLVSISSEDIFGLTDENLDEYIQEYFLPDFEKEFRRQLGML